MNWKDVPHLFMNGKFKIKTKTSEGHIIVGYDFETRCCLSIPIRQPEGAEFYDYNNIEDCTLIARPIFDMTDKEQTDYDNLTEYPVPQSKLTRQTICLLSIGVYPFDQNADNVIFKRKEEKIMSGGYDEIDK